MTPHQRVAAYYGQIDANDIPEILRVFSPDAVYERAGKAYQGEKRISRFFRQERLIRGCHEMSEIWKVPGHVVALGAFIGHGEAGDPRKVRFADIWTFGPDDEVPKRRTYLATDHAVVER
ncbi:nuclear transport factor 2 family protein [Sphingopyxis sp. C-1]|uniref:nuclear transport factor 2 family protein n=1 Tax=Sphingopyxis sp. C-1 TaxID=262667 RepID=UPI0006C2C9D0|nr:nuclear transport factor 2 family protein [Sphingopyxis sp. C-1]GAO80959.1 hypothetical protein SC1_04285 [Sphingopyxis sp. C-1]